MNGIDNDCDVLSRVAIGLTGLIAVVWLSGCSFKVEAGYHGKTGVHDTTASDMAGNHWVYQNESKPVKGKARGAILAGEE